MSGLLPNAYLLFVRIQKYPSAASCSELEVSVFFFFSCYGLAVVDAFCLMPAVAPRPQHFPENQRAAHFESSGTQRGLAATDR